MQAKHLVALAGLFALWLVRPVMAAEQEPESVSIPADGEKPPARL